MSALTATDATAIRWRDAQELRALAHRVAEFQFYHWRARTDGPEAEACRQAALVIEGLWHLARHLEERHG